MCDASQTRSCSSILMTPRRVVMMMMVVVVVVVVVVFRRYTTRVGQSTGGVTSYAQSQSRVSRIDD